MNMDNAYPWHAFMVNQLIFTTTSVNVVVIVDGLVHHVTYHSAQNHQNKVMHALRLMNVKLEWHSNATWTSINVYAKMDIK